MNEPWNADERLAAFLDGKLGGRDRTEVMALLVREDEAYEVFAHTAVVLRQAEAGDGGEAYAAVPAGARPWSPAPARADRWPHAEPATAIPDALAADMDALLARMQSPEVQVATRRAFDASPDELRQAAREAARRGDG